MAQDDYYYEVQLTNKQLVFYFMAGAAGLILSFLAGVMVGRGVDSGALGAGEAHPRQVVEEKVVAESSPTPAASDLSYSQRLEGEQPANEGLERPAGASAGTPPATAPPARSDRTAVSPAPAAAPTRPPATPRPATPPATQAPAASPGLPRTAGTGAQAKGFAVQVGAFKDKASADGVVRSLKGRGLAAYAVAPDGGGLFTVRVGVYRDRADAETVQGRLRDDKFKPYIIKQ